MNRACLAVIPLALAPAIASAQTPPPGSPPPASPPPPGAAPSPNAKPGYPQPYGQPYPGQPQGQPSPGQPAYPAQPYPGQPYPPRPGQPYPGQPGQPYPGQPGQPYPAQPGQPYPGQPGPQYPYGQPYPYPGQPNPQYPYAYPAPYTPPPPAKSSPSGEPRVADHTNQWVTFGIGFTGGVGIAVLDKPDDQSLNGVPNVTPLYSGFSGLDTAIGASFELRLLGYGGIEVDVLSAHEHGSADITVTKLSATQTASQSTFKVKIGHSAVHVPLLFKGAVPGKIVTPVFFLGPEFVMPSKDADFENEGDNLSNTAHTAYTEKYTMFAFGLGLEFNLPIPKVDIRIPLSLRGGYNPSVSNHRGDRMIGTQRADGTFSEMSYSTSWQWTGRGQLGLAVHF